MRHVAPLLLVLTIGALSSPGLAADNLMLIGKPVSWEIRGEEPKGISEKAVMGEALETPNQQRRRLGLAVEASFPAQESGIAEETPNHRRQREAKELLVKAQ